MDSVASGYQSYISARVNQELRSEFAVLSFQLARMLTASRASASSSRAFRSFSRSWM